MAKKNLISLLDKDRIVSGENLASRLGITRQALHKQVSGLRKKGYGIEGKPRTGYRIVSLPDVLIPERVRDDLRTEKIGGKVFHKTTIPSTQDLAKELAEQGESEGTLVVAEKQSHGRGRRGRTWTSDKGGIWASLILRPDIAPQKVPLLALVASVAIAEAIDGLYSIPCGLKWPNDVLIAGKDGKTPLKTEGRKVCGILTEMSSDSDRVKWVILGFGVNVNNPVPSSLKNQAASLSDALGRKLDRVALLQAILRELEKSYGVFLNEGFISLNAQYMHRSVLSYLDSVLVSDADSRIQGKFLKIDDDGSLTILVEGGKTVRFLAGDVTLLAKSTRI